MVIFTWFSLTDSQVGHMCRSCYINRFSYNAVWGCRFYFFFFFWALRKQSHGTVPHTYRRSQSKFIFNKSSAKIWTPLWESTAFFFFFFFFFTVKYWLQQTLFLLLRRGTTYLSENGPHHEKTCFCPMWTTKAQISLRIHAVWSAPLLFAAWIVTRFYSSKLYSSIGTYTVSPTRQFAESVLSLHVHLFKSK